MSTPPIRHPVRILGIDPGLRRTGWGVIEIDGNRLIFVGCGSVEPPEGLALASRLLAIHEGLAAVLGDFQPMEAAVEQTFVNKDGVATLIVVTSERNEVTKRKDLTTFTYDTSRCMFCGLCEDACPVDALELTQDFEMATYTREGQIWDRQMLEEGPKPTQYKC